MVRLKVSGSVVSVVDDSFQFHNGPIKRKATEVKQKLIEFQFHNGPIKSSNIVRLFGLLVVSIPQWSD